MTVYLDGEAIRALADEDVCYGAAAFALRAEAEGRTQLPPRIDVPSGHGFLRVMPAVLDDVMGLKVMTLAEGVGTRYLVLLYDVHSGELLGLLDADELTRLRTATCTAVAAQLMVTTPPTRMGVIGSGFEAEGHLLALARLWPLTSISVFSPSETRRVAFADRMTNQLGLPVEPAATAEEAVARTEVVVLATKSKEPVIDGSSLPRSAVVLSIGSTRPDLRELDTATLRRSGTVVVDDAAQVMAESGDIMAAFSEGALGEERLVPVSRVAVDPALLQRDGDRDLLTFKSVGTALQDLALAKAVLAKAQKHPEARELGDLVTLKPFAGSAAVVGGRA